MKMEDSLVLVVYSKKSRVESMGGRGEVQE
jgi:hypothetical protein